MLRELDSNTVSLVIDMKGIKENGVDAIEDDLTPFVNPNVSVIYERRVEEEE